MKVLKVTLAVTLAVGLILGATLPGLANSDEPAPQIESPPHPRTLKGKVSNIDEDEGLFTIQVGEQDIDIRVNEGTRCFIVTAPLRAFSALRHYRMGPPEIWEQIRGRAPVMPMGFKAAHGMPSLRPGKSVTDLAPFPAEIQQSAANLSAPGWGKEKPKHLPGYLRWLHRFGEAATLGDMAIGDRVIVLVVPNEGEPLAKLVLIIKPTAHHRIFGEVIQITENTVTIAPEDGDDVELNYNEDTIFILRGTPFLEEGDEVVAIYVETEGGLLAKRIRHGGRLPEPVD